jgi:Ca2+-transporting ATPase
MLLAAVGVALTLQLAGIHLPVLQDLLGTQSLGLGDLLIAAACSSLGYAAIRLDRLIHPANVQPDDLRAALDRARRPGRV